VPVPLITFQSTAISVKAGSLLDLVKALHLHICELS